MVVEHTYICPLFMHYPQSIMHMFIIWFSFENWKSGTLLFSKATNENQNNNTNIHIHFTCDWRHWFNLVTPNIYGNTVVLLQMNQPKQSIKYSIYWLRQSLATSLLSLEFFVWNFQTEFDRNTIDEGWVNHFSIIIFRLFFSLSIFREKKTQTTLIQLTDSDDNVILSTQF